MQIQLESFDKAMIIAAVNGPTSKAQNPNVPLDSKEIIRDAVDCFHAGACILHVHPKGPDGGPTADLEIFRRIIEGVRERCEILIQIGNDFGMFPAAGGGKRTATYEERLTILDVRPPVDISTINSGSFSAGGRDFLNPNEFNAAYARKASQHGIPLLCQTYDFSHIQNNLLLVRDGALRSPVHFSFVTGYDGGIDSHPKHLMNMVDFVPEGSVWELVAKRNHFPMLMNALSLGGHIRTGFEDHYFVKPGELANSNAQLIDKAAGMVRDSGREVATVADAKRLWGIS